MALMIRFLSQPGRLVLTANGHSYAVSGAATVDVPFDQALAIQSDQAERLIVVGATPDRPTAVPGGANYRAQVPRTMYDTTLAAVIFSVPGSFPTTWVDIQGAAA